MSRLLHDYKSYIATFRMTRNALVVFFEGKENDPGFYSRIEERYEADTDLGVELRRASDLPRSAQNRSASGGKFWLFRAAIFWCAYLEEHKPQVKCGLLLAIDKDVDDVFPTALPSMNVVYTQGYSVENYLIASCSLEAAVTNAFSLLPGDITPLFGPSQESWLNWAVVLWREWIEFCLLTKAYPKAKVHGYGGNSRFNKPRHSPTDNALEASELDRLRRAASVSDPEFEAVRSAVKALVEDAISSGNAHRIFKGEWFVEILFSQTQADAYLKRNSVQSGVHGIWSAIRSSYLLPDHIYGYYRLAFDNALLPSTANRTNFRAADSA